MATAVPEGERLVQRADRIARDLGHHVSRRIADGTLRIVGVSTLEGDLRAAVEEAFGPLQNGVIVVAERQY